MIESFRRWSSLAALCATFAGASPALAEEDFRPTSFPSLSLAKQRTFGAEFYVDNRDRDPLGIDVFDVGFRFRIQAGEHTEVFANVIADRVVSLPETPAVPSSPRDLIFAGPAYPVPSVFQGEHPYLDHRGNASFDAFIPGTTTIGFTRLLRTDGLALGFSAAVAIPMAGSLNALRSGANSGRPDGVLALLGSHDLGGGKLHARAGFTIAGKGSWSDRSISVVGNAVQTTVTNPPIGNRLDIGVAWMRPLTDSTALALEARTVKEFVSDLRIDAVTPVDVILGVQKAFGRFHFSAGLLDHLRPLPSGELRANPLAGAIDLSNVEFLDRNAFLTRVGLLAAAGQVRDGAHIIVIGVNTTTLPTGAFRIAPTYNIRSEHNLGYIFTLTFRR